MSWPLPVQPFGILAAGLYSENGLGTYLFFIAATLPASLPTHELGRTDEIQGAILREVRRFIGDAPQFDDIAVGAVIRDGSSDGAA